MVPFPALCKPVAYKSFCSPVPHRYKEFSQAGSVRHGFLALTRLLGIMKSKLFISSSTISAIQKSSSNSRCPICKPNFPNCWTNACFPVTVSIWDQLVGSLLDSLPLTVFSMSVLLMVILAAVSTFSMHFPDTGSGFIAILLLLLFYCADLNKNLRPHLRTSGLRWHDIESLQHSDWGKGLFTRLLWCFVLAQPSIIKSWHFIVNVLTVPALNYFLQVFCIIANFTCFTNQIYHFF